MVNTERVMCNTTQTFKHTRLQREHRTFRAMLRIYCRDHHGAPDGSEFCDECRELFEYATERLRRCVFQEAKPTCANCPVHCYRATYREQVKAMMRYAGPRMLWRHPLLAIRHLLDGRRPVPDLKTKRALAG